MKRIRLFVTLMVLLTGCSMVSHAQIGRKILKTVGESAERATLRKAGQTTEEAIEKVTDPNTYKGDKEEKPEKGGETEQTASPQNASNDNTSAPSPGGKTQATLESYSQYDFVPGDRILFFEDFSQDAVGDFPALWTTNAAGEVKTLNNFPGKWFQITTSSGVFTCLTKIDLPANFIIEFDYIPYYSEEAQQKNPGRVNWYAAAIMRLYNDKEDKFKELDTGLYPGGMGMNLGLSNNGWGVRGYNYDHRDNSYGQENTSNRNLMKSEQINHVIIWVQNRRVRIYHDGAKVVDGPTLLLPDTRFSRILFANDHEDNRPFFSNIKITTAGSDTRSKLLTDGKLISYGIYFDVNKDVVKPESYGALNDIAKVLKENAEVKIRIVGHTDSDGDDASNLDLSKRRAASVKAALAQNFGIDASRMETDGKGESEPLTSNATPAEKAQNRRVEFVRI